MRPMRSQIGDALQITLAALAGALMIKFFVLDAVYIPSRSMEGALRHGDYVLVNKLLYGARIPGRLPLLHSSLPFGHLPGLSALQRGDVVVFELPPGAFPEGRETERVTFVKRCAALAGDEVRLDRGRVVVNGEELRRESWRGDPAAAFGPVRVPRTGDILTLAQATAAQWERLIRGEGHSVERLGSTVLIDGAPATTYAVTKDYVFVLGDNLNHSYDSRMWGFLPQENIIGNAMLVYWSVDPASVIRWDRIGARIR